MEGQVSANWERLRTNFQHYASYHNHKEVMAYSIFALEGAFFLGLFLLGNWPPTVEAMPTELLSAIFVVTWFLFHTALRFQLRNRRLAAIKTAALFDALKQTKPVKYNASSMAPLKAHPIEAFFDTYFLPIRTTFREGDVDLINIEDGQDIEPGTLEAEVFFEIKHRKASQNSWNKYALPMEWITAIGSFSLLVIALLRVHGT